MWNSLSVKLFLKNDEETRVPSFFKAKMHEVFASALKKPPVLFLVTQLRKASKQPSEKQFWRGERYMKGKKGGENTNMFDEMNVISSYPLQQAVEDGVLVEIFKNRWKRLSDGMPIVATAHIFEEVSLAGMMEIWNEFVVWRKEVMPTLAEEERLFSTPRNSRKVRVIEDGAAFTLMYPEDY